MSSNQWWIAPAGAVRPWFASLTVSGPVVGNDLSRFITRSRDLAVESFWTKLVKPTILWLCAPVIIAMLKPVGSTRAFSLTDGSSPVRTVRPTWGVTRC